MKPPALPSNAGSRRNSKSSFGDEGGPCTLDPGYCQRNEYRLLQCVTHHVHNAAAVAYKRTACHAILKRHLHAVQRLRAVLLEGRVRFDLTWIPYGGRSPNACTTVGGRPRATGHCRRTVNGAGTGALPAPLHVALDRATPYSSAVAARHEPVSAYCTRVNLNVGTVRLPPASGSNGCAVPNGHTAQLEACAVAPLIVTHVPLFSVGRLHHNSRDGLSQPVTSPRLWA